MSDLPVLTASEIIKALGRGGFLPTRTKGSHKVLKHADGRWTTVADHGRRDVEPRMLRIILREGQITPDEFLRCSAASRGPVSAVSALHAGLTADGNRMRESIIGQAVAVMG